METSSQRIPITRPDPCGTGPERLVIFHAVISQERIYEYTLPGLNASTDDLEIDDLDLADSGWLVSTTLW